MAHSEAVAAVAKELAEEIRKEMAENGRSSRLPRYLVHLMLFIIPERNRKYIIGDLEEEYSTTYKRFPRLWYWGQVIALLANYWWAALRRLAGLDAIRKVIRK